MSQERIRRLAAVWFADIVGYTDLSARDENAALSVVDELQRISREEVESRGGRIVKFQGDAVLSVFDSADTALKSALALQDGFNSAQVVQDSECALRIGLHLGEIIEADDGDVYGDGVNVASRIEGQAEAGQVVVSEVIQGLLKQQAEHSFHPFGPVKLKGVEESMWLYVVGEPGAEVAVADEPPSALESSWLYRIVTEHWPKVALGTVGAAVGATFTLGDLGGTSLESYAFAWAATTAGIWFLFDKAEAAMAGPVRKQAAGWLRKTDFTTALESIPGQFAVLFDWVFGEKHFSKKCFGRSSTASAISVILVAALMLTSGGLANVPNARYAFAAAIVLFFLSTLFNRWAPGWSKRLVSRWPILNRLRPLHFGIVIAGGFGYLTGAGKLTLPTIFGDVGATLGIGLLVLFFLNLIPDYLSLLETRWTLRWISRARYLAPILLVDFFLTWAIWGIWFVSLLLLVGLIAAPPGQLWPDVSLMASRILTPGLAEFLFYGPEAQNPRNVAFRISFLTTFLTSIWLWLHILSVVLSRTLLKMNAGVGFLLRVTDVERQPFRSMGFVSVIITSVIFALGLPLVLL